NPKLNYTWTMGRQSLKAGYEFQKIDVEVMDVNPLYGRDSYTGQFTRPAGAAANNIYNLADFMLGLRAQYALSNPLVAQMRRQMPKTVLRGGWGIGYVHNQRTGAADLLPINGPQVINAVVNQTNPADASFRTTEQGYPAGLTDPLTFNPLTANISFIPRDYHS